jgi:uncharacterized membrane protein (Fun14 family)
MFAQRLAHILRRTRLEDRTQDRSRCCRTAKSSRSILGRAGAPAAAAVSAAAALSQPAAPAECGWLFGKSKEVKRLEADNSRLEETVKQLETEKSVLEAKTLITVLSESIPEGGAAAIEYGKLSIGDAYEKGFPQEISIGFAAGGCVGYATKIAFKVTAAALGGCFIFLQLLQYQHVARQSNRRAMPRMSNRRAAAAHESNRRAAAAHGSNRRA